MHPASPLSCTRSRGLPALALSLWIPTWSAACGSDTKSSDSEPTEADTDTDTDSDTDSDSVLVGSLRTDALLGTDTVSCTLEDGSTSTCHKLTFSSDVPFEIGPFCPETIDDIGGVGVYDGATNPGFQVMKRSLWESMEADGYDIVDEDGNIRIIDGPEDGPPGENGCSKCLALPIDTMLTLTYLIPTDFAVASSSNTIDTVEKLGVTLDGAPLTGNPPSATSGPPGMEFDGFAAIPSIDPCGGHPDPAGYYHPHFAAEAMSTVFSAHGITEVSCETIAQSQTALVGWALDGAPIYAPEDTDGTPTDLDACSGHTGATPDFPDGTSHYHASATEAPNLPDCLSGVSAQDAVMIR